MTPWTTAHQAPLSMGFPRQENWSGLPFSSPRNLARGWQLGRGAVIEEIEGASPSSV